MSKTIAVTGATGYVGRFVVAELHRRGVTVRALSRPSSDQRGFAHPITWIEGTLHSGNDSEHGLALLVNGVDAVIHLAYEHVPGRYRGGEGDHLDAWLDANLTGTLRLLIAARDAQVPQFIFLSSRAVFSRTAPGRVLDETHPTSPNTHYGAYKNAVEAFLCSFAHVHGMKTYSLRATGIYGLTWPVERTKWWSLITGVLSGIPSMTIRSGTEIHGNDVAKVIWTLLDSFHTQDDRSGDRSASKQNDLDVIHLSDLVVTTRDVVSLVRHLANLPGPLPDEPPHPPTNPLACHRIAELGISLGGRPLFEQTISQLVHIAEG